MGWGGPCSLMPGAPQGAQGGGADSISSSQRAAPPQGTLAGGRPALPFIPNLDRRPYLLIMMKRTTSSTQAKAASPTAMDTCEGPK